MTGRSVLVLTRTAGLSRNRMASAPKPRSGAAMYTQNVMAATIVTFGLLLFPRPAAACSCAGTPSTPGALRSSDLVFLGTVVSVSSPHYSTRRQTRWLHHHLGRHPAQRGAFQRGPHLPRRRNRIDNDAEQQWQQLRFQVRSWGVLAPSMRTSATPWCHCTNASARVCRQRPLRISDTWRASRAASPLVLSRARCSEG